MMNIVQIRDVIANRNVLRFVKMGSSKLLYFLTLPKTSSITIKHNCFCLVIKFKLVLLKYKVHEKLCNSLNIDITGRPRILGWLREFLYFSYNHQVQVNTA